VSGRGRRGLELIRRLSEHFDVHLLVVSETCARDLGNAAALHRYCHDIEILAAAPRRHVHDALEPEEPEQVARHHSDRATGRVGEILASQAVDLIHVDGFYLMQHIPDWVDVPVLLVEQNVEYDLERQQVATFSDLLGDRRALGACARTRATELECCSRASLIGAVTVADRELIQAVLPGADVRLVPDGVDHLTHLRAAGSKGVTGRPPAPLLMLPGDFACGPEADAAVHFCETILPRIRETVPDTHLWLVGDAPAPEIQALAGDTVRVTGPVTDLMPYLDAADVVVCPFRVGGALEAGAREALRRGKATVSTSIGARQLSGEVRSALVIADDEETFAGAVSSLLVDPQGRAELEHAARCAAMQLPRWDDTAQELASIYDELLTGRGTVDRRSSVEAGTGAGASA
jgi:glycosyltransferase involved in cell wall biosynthesis